MVLGQKWWVLAVCLVWAAGHCPCSVLLSSMPLGIVVVVAPCTVIIALRLPSSSRCALLPCPSPLSHAVVIIAMRHCHCHRRSVVVSPCPALLCTVAALSCCCCAAGSATVVSLHCHYCTISIIALSGVVTVVPLGAVVAPSLHRQACKWGGGEGAAGTPCMWCAWLLLSRCAIVAVVGSSSRATDIMRLCTMPGRCSPVEGG